MTSVGEVSLGVKLDKSGLAQQVGQVQQEVASKLKDVEIKANTQKARDEFRGFAKEGQRGIKTPVDADTNLAKQKFKELGEFAKKALGEVARGVGQGIGINLANSIQGSVAGAVGGVAGTVKEGLGTFIEFQDKLTTFGAVANATKEETKALADEAKRLGIETSKSPVQVGEAAVQLAKLGFSAKDTKEQVEGVVRLSEASGLADLGKAAEVAGAAFNVFGTNTKKTADIVAATSNATAADAQDLLQAISSAGGVAKANNQSFETLAATFGLLRSAGFQAEAAGTGVKTLISNLGAPSSAEAKQGLEQLGVQVFDTSGKMRNLKDLLPEFRKSLSGLTEQRQASLTKAIFGDSGAPAFLALLSTAQSKIDDTFNTVESAESSNAAGEAAKKLLTGLPGQLKLLEGSVATLKLNLGEAIAPAFEGLAKLGTDTANEILKTSGILDGLKGSAEGFKATLEENPELAKELAASLGEAGKVLADEVAGGAQALTDYLKENPRAIADLVSGTADFVKLLQEAVGFAGKVVDKLGEGAQRLKGLLNQDAGDQEGTAQAIKGSGGTKADVDAVEKRTRDQANRESATANIGGVDVRFGVIGADRIAAIRQKEAQKQLDEIRDRTLAKDSEKSLVAAAAEADAGKVSSAKGAPDSAQKGEGTDTSEKTKGGLLKDIQDFSRDLTLKENKLSESADKEITIAKKAQLARTKTAQETEAAIAQIQARESQGKVKAIEASIAQIDAAEKTGQVGAKEAETKRSELQKKLAVAGKADLENQIKARDAANRAILEKEEQRVKAQQSLIDRTEFTGTQTIRTTELDSKEAQLQGTGGARAVGQEEAVQLQTLALQKSVSAQKIALLQGELQKNQELRQSGVRTAKEATEKELQLEEQLRSEQGRLTENRAQVLEAQTQRELKTIQARVDTQKRASQAIVAEIDREKAAQENLSKSFERAGKLLESQSGLSKAVADSRQSTLQQRTNLADESIDGSKQLASGDIGSALRGVLQRQLGTSVGPGDQTQVLALIKNRQALEAEADREKLAALQQQQQFDRAGLELDLARQQLAAKTAVIEAKRSAQLAKQNELEAEGNLRKTERTGTTDEILNAKQVSDLAKQGTDLAKQGVDNALQGLGVQDQLRKNAEATLAIKEKTAEQELRQTNAARARNREREIAGEIDKARNGGVFAGSGFKGTGESADGVTRPDNVVDQQINEDGSTYTVYQAKTQVAKTLGPKTLGAQAAPTIQESGINIPNQSGPAINIPNQSMPPSSAPSSGLEQTSNDLRTLMQQILSAPRQLVVNGVENPRQDASSIWADFSRKQVGASGQ